MYTDVVIQSVKVPDPARTGIEIVLVAQGTPPLPDVPDLVWLNGVPFDPQLLRDAARTLLARLNAQIAALVTLRALVGTRVDVTPPETP